VVRLDEPNRRKLLEPLCDVARLARVHSHHGAIDGIDVLLDRRARGPYGVALMASLDAGIEADHQLAGHARALCWCAGVSRDRVTSQRQECDQSKKKRRRSDSVGPGI